ncbi:unnamed protein product, partial [Oreochromis niloticus]
MPRKSQRSQSQKLRWQKQKEQVNVSQSGEEVKVSVTTIPSPEVQSSVQTAAVSYADVVKRGVPSACVPDAKVQQVIQTEPQVTVQTQHDGEAPGPSHVQVTNNESRPRVSSICASRSQAAAKYGKYRNQQCMANSLVFLSFLHEDEFITRADLNRVLDKGHAVYSDARKRFVNSVFLACDELPTVVTSRRHEYQVDMSQFAHYGTFDGTDHFPSLEQGLQCLASAVRYALLVMGGTVIAVCRLTSGEYAYFDPHPRKSTGMPLSLAVSGGTAVMLKFTRLNDMIDRIKRLYRMFSIAPSCTYELQPVEFHSENPADQRDADENRQTATTVPAPVLNEPEFETPKSTEQTQKTVTDTLATEVMSSRVDYSNEPAAELNNRPSDYLEIETSASSVRDTQVKICKRENYSKHQTVAQQCLTGKFVHVCDEACNDQCSFPVERKKEYICHTCHSSLKSGRMPRLAAVNGLDLQDIPAELCDLNILERHLIAKCIPFAKIIPLPKGRQRLIRGNVVCVPSEVQQTVDCLPRLRNQSQIMRIKLKRRLCYKGHQLFQTVTWSKLIQALRKLKQIHPQYTDIVIRDDALLCDPTLPDDDSSDEASMASDDYDEADLMEIDNYEKDALLCETESESEQDIDMQSCDEQPEEQNPEEPESDLNNGGFALESCLQPVDISEEILSFTDNTYCVAPAERNNPVSFFRTHIRNVTKPETPEYEEMSLADFAALCRLVSGPNEGKDVLPLLNQLGFVQRRKNDKPAIIRYYHCSQEKDPEQYYGRLLRLYLPHRSEQELKPQGFQTYQSFYNSGCVRLPCSDHSESVKRVVKRNKDKYEKNSEDIESALEEFEQNRDVVIDEWCNLAPESEVVRLQCDENLPERHSDDENEQENVPDYSRQSDAVTEIRAIREQPAVDPAV